MTRLLALFLLLSVGARAHVRQRYFLESVQGEGTESIIHWNFGNAVRVNMHQYAGYLSSAIFGGVTCTVGAATVECIDFATAQSLMGDSLSQWRGAVFGGLVPDMSLLLDGANPYATSSNCEVANSTTGDSINNIIFSSKRNTSCSYSLSSGTIGLTRIRYTTTSGEIVEADVQFDDTNYRYTTSGANDLSASPPVINLRNVATHELGHFFGLDHSSVRDSSMIFSVADGLDSAANDDKMGILSLYSPPNLNAAVGQAKGSVTVGGSPVFGASVFFMNARTLTMSAADMTDVNGAFSMCALPPGPQIVFSTRYKPFGANIHEYYSGTGDGVTVSDAAGCFNPGCALMTQTLSASFLTADKTYGADLKIVSIQAGSTSAYLNIPGSTSTISLAEPPSTSPGDLLAVDQPRLGKLGSTAVAVNGTEAARGPHYYHFVATAAAMQVRTAALSLYGRLKLTPTLYLSDGSTAITSVSSPEACTLTDPVPALPQPRDQAPNKDPWLDCTGLVAGDTYVLKLTATAISCTHIPGNSSSCAISGIEAASSNLPLYMVTAFATANLNDTTLATTASLEGISAASSRWLYMPTCGAKNGGVVDTTLSHDDGGGGCCGSLSGPSAPDPRLSLLLAILFSPVTWFGLWWGIKRRFGRR